MTDLEIIKHVEDKVGLLYLKTGRVVLTQNGKSLTGRQCIDEMKKRSPVGLELIEKYRLGLELMKTIKAKKNGR